MKDVIKKNVSLTEMSDNVIDRYPIQGLYGVISKADYMDDIINISFENEKMAEELISKEYMKEEEVLMPMYLSKEDFVYVTKILQIKKDATSI